MKNSQLIQNVKRKSRASNALMAGKVIFDLLSQVFVIYLISKGFSKTLTIKTIKTTALFVFACFFLKALCAYGATWLAHQTAYNCLTDLRLKIIRHLKKLSLGFFQDRKTGDLTNIIQHDVEQVEIYLAHGLPEIVAAQFLPLVIFLIMLFVDWRLALVMIAGIPLMTLTRVVSAPIWKKNFGMFSEKTKAMQENIMEYVQNISVIKAFGKDENKTQKTLQSSKDYVTWVKKSMNGVSIPMGFIALFMESGVVLVMILGMLLLSKGEIDIPRFILSMILGTFFTSSIAKNATFQHYGVVFNQAMAGIGSILNVPLPTRENTTSNPISSGDIEIENLSFAYEGKPNALENINLTFKQGSKNALVGASGCGKTTLGNILMGFWIPDSGYVCVGGSDTKNFNAQQVSSLFSIVQQDVFLFNTSMEDNIRIGKPNATKEEIITAAKKARIHDFIMSLPHKYESTAGESGVKFSGGEKQRISIARMILKDAPIVILDEATAAVDTENEAHIHAAIDDLSQDKTVITIAHHLSTIQDADQIVVMDSGQVVDNGTHEELYKRCALYKHMVENQNKVDNWKIKEAQ